MPPQQEQSKKLKAVYSRLFADDKKARKGFSLSCFFSFVLLFAFLFLLFRRQTNTKDFETPFL